MSYKTFLKLGLTLSAFVLTIAACSQKPVEAGIDQSATLSSISGGVYFDENMNEDCEECECGLEDIRILLYKGTCSGTMWQSAKTDAEGAFKFSELDAGQYCVMPDLPPTCDGFMPTTSIAQQITLGNGEDLEITWFGYTSFIDVQPTEEEE